MKHALYESPITHKFALLRLPDHFADGDTVPILPSDYWFSSREEALRHCLSCSIKTTLPRAANGISNDAWWVIGLT
jgi:hypothetical protein